MSDSGKPASLREAAPGIARTLRRLRAPISRERPLICGGLVALLAEVAFRLVEPWPLKFVIDRVIAPDPASSATGVGFADALDPMVLLALSGVAVVVAAGGRALTAYLSTVAFALAGNRVLTRTRAELYEHLQRLSLSFHDRARNGDLITHLTSDIGRLQEATVTAALPLVGNVLTLLGMLAVMAWLHLPLALIALAVFPFFLFSASRRTKRISAVARKQRHVEGALASVASESLGAIEVVQTYQLEAEMERTFDSSNRQSMKDGVKAKRLSAGLERKTDVLIAIGTGLVLFAGAREVLAGKLTVGDLVVFLTYMKHAFKPMRDVAKYTGRMAKASASGERIVALLDTEVEVVDRPTAAPAPPLAGALGFERVSFSYADGSPVLSGLDLHVHAGQRVALTGPSGTGKSSVAALVTRLYDPTAGRVTVDGVDLRDLTLDSLRRQIAIVLQDSVLFHAPVRDNIRFGRLDATDAEIEDAARLAGAHDFITELPDGYDTILSERGASLSGGQRQRIAVARAAVRDAAIILLDEPTRGLDAHNEREVSDALERLCAGRTSILITHDLAAATTADRVCWLEDGRIVEAGTHREMLDLDGRYAATYRKQALLRAADADEKEVTGVLDG